MGDTKRKNVSGTAESLSFVLHPQRLWRTIPAKAFDEHRRLQVLGHVGGYMTTIKEWKEALAGDAACAVRIALRTQIPGDRISCPVDARMTLLLHCALNGSAALVLAHLLRRMPLESEHRNRLATSWLARKQFSGAARRRFSGRDFPPSPARHRRGPSRQGGGLVVKIQIFSDLHATVG